MDENASGQAHDPLSAPESAINIRRYLNDNRSAGSPRTTSVVLQVVTGSESRERIASASDGSPDSAVRLAIDRLRRRRVPKAS